MLTRNTQMLTKQMKCGTQVFPFEIALGLAAGIVMLFYKTFNVNPKLSFPLNIPPISAQPPP